MYYTDCLNLSPAVVETLEELLHRNKKLYCELSDAIFFYYKTGEQPENLKKEVLSYFTLIKLHLDKKNHISKSKIEDKQHLNVYDVVAITGLKRTTVYNLVTHNKIPFHRQDGVRKVWFIEQEILEWIKSGGSSSNNQ